MKELKIHVYIQISDDCITRFLKRLAGISEICKIYCAKNLGVFDTTSFQHTL